MASIPAEKPSPEVRLGELADPSLQAGKDERWPMITALLCVETDNLAVGFVGDHAPQYRFSIKGEDLGDRLRLYAVLHATIDALLTPHRALRVVIVEPPLFPLKVKQLFAEILLDELRVSAIGFFPRSVSCLAGNQLPAGLVIDKDEGLAVPCFDFRELGGQICGLEEGNPTDNVWPKLTRDTRRPITQHIVNVDYTKTWQGASALLKRHQVWPLITREKFRNKHRVWDAMYDMR